GAHLRAAATHAMHAPGGERRVNVFKVLKRGRVVSRVESAQVEVQARTAERFGCMERRVITICVLEDVAYAVCIQLHRWLLEQRSNRETATDDAAASDPSRPS